MKIVRFFFNSYRVCTYLLIDDSGECVLIDAANETEKETDRLISYIQEKQLNLKALLNTHCHVDHILGVKVLMERFQVPFYADALEEKNVRWAEAVAPMMGFALNKPRMPEPLSEEFSFGSTLLKVLKCPGHTAGGVSFYSPENGVVFSGDTLFAGSVGRTDFPGGDLDNLMNSIRQQLLTLPPDTVVYPGHGPETTIREEILHNPFLGNPNEYSEISM